MKATSTRVAAPVAGADYVSVLPSAEVAEGAIVAADLKGRVIALCRHNGTLFAIDDRCSHAGAKLSAGKVHKGTIMCPLHGARFDLATGHCLSKVQDFTPVAVHDTREVNGMIEVLLHQEHVKTKRSAP